MTKINFFRVKNLIIILVLPVISIIVGSTVVFGQSKIESLTSKKKAQEASKKLKKKHAPRLPNTIGRHSLGVGLGQTFLQGDFDDSGDDKITVDLLYNYSASHSFDMLANFHWSKHSFRKKYAEILGLNTGIKGKLYQFDAFAPFLLAGLGFYSPKVKRDITGNGTLKESESKLVFGTHFGLGADLRLNDHFLMGLLGQYHNPFDVKQEIGPKVEGSYFKLLITTLYTF